MDAIEEYDPENIYEARLELSIIGDDKDDIMAIGGEYGYKRVFDTIMEDLAERKTGN